MLTELQLCLQQLSFSHNDNKGHAQIPSDSSPMPNAKGKRQNCACPTAGEPQRWQPPLQNHKADFITVTDHGCGFLIKPPGTVLWGQSFGFILLAIANENSHLPSDTKGPKTLALHSKHNQAACSHSS